MPGLNDLRVTLYDIFGYLLPGLAALASLAILAWAVFLPRHPLHEPQLTSATWFSLLILSYVLGHLVHAISTLIGLGRHEEKRVFDGLPPETRNALESASGGLREVLQSASGSHEVQGPESETGKVQESENQANRPRLLYEFCAAAVEQFGKTSAREVFTYREGFYRGLFVALALGVVSVITRMLKAGSAMLAGGKSHPLG